MAEVAQVAIFAKAPLAGTVKTRVAPLLGAEDLRAAANSLTGHDAVFQPAEDGGYVMVGLARMVPGIFDGIQWGEGTVMRDTRTVLTSSRAYWREMPVLWDVDRPEDYVRLIASGLLEQDQP